MRIEKSNIWGIFPFLGCYLSGGMSGQTTSYKGPRLHRDEEDEDNYQEPVLKAQKSL